MVRLELLGVLYVKKVAWWFIGIYALYIVFMLLYFLQWTDPGVPPDVKGTAADPEMFKTDQQLVLSQELSNIQNLLSFLTIPLDWGIYLFILIFGFSRWLRNRSEEVTGLSVVHTVIYFLGLSILTFLITLPINYVGHVVSVNYGLSVQPLSDWLRDTLVSFWVNWIISLITVVTIFFFIRKYPKRWWLPVWLLSIPFTIFLVYIQPVVIDPLYNDFNSLSDGALKEQILNLADKADIPAEDVYEVNKSEETTTMNAYVNGLGSNLRIVLWDTTLQKLKDSEVLFTMAHEMGHYVKHHLLYSVGGSIVGMLIGLYLTSQLLLRIVRRWGARLGIKGPGDLAALPVILLIFSVLSFAAQPVQNVISRHAEHEADKYAVQLTQEPEDGINSFQKMTANSLSPVNPPALVKFVSYGHPTMMERIMYLEKMKDRMADDETKKEE